MGSMISAGEVLCRIPTDGIKPDYMFCTEPEAYRLAEWTAGTGLVSAGATALLAIFAFTAWMLSRKTLKAMETQIQVQIDTAAQTLERQSLERYLAVLGELTVSDEPIQLRGKYSAAFGSWMLGLDARADHIALTHQVGSLLLENVLEQHWALSKSKSEQTDGADPAIPGDAYYYAVINSASVFTNALVQWRQGQKSDSEFTKELFDTRTRLLGFLRNDGPNPDGSISIYPNLTNPKITDMNKYLAKGSTIIKGPIKPTDSEDTSKSGQEK